MKRLFYASLALVTLASCQKESTIDSSLTTGKEITYSPYASASVTKGSAVDSNDDFVGVADSYGSFEVAAYSGSSTYFGFSNVTYNGTTWENKDSMYWPNETASLHFGAYYPSSVTLTDASYSYSSAHLLKFGYTVEEDVAKQVDLMYAVSDYTYTAPTTGESDTPESTTSVPLHFKHALTQVGFTATKSDDIDVTVTSIKVCNVVDNGAFTATIATTVSNVYDTDSNKAQDAANVETDDMGSWSPSTASAYVPAGDNAAVDAENLQNYTATMAFDDTDTNDLDEDANGSTSTYIKVLDGTTPTTLTSITDVMMLLPQTLTAWSPTGTSNSGTESYLAIDCKITHADATAAIVEGTIYVPFSTADVSYGVSDNRNGTWQPGYKLTYNLDFGGGYTIPGGGDGDDPEDTPGTVPDPDDVVPTLRAITYTVTVDEWITVTPSTDVTL